MSKDNSPPDVKNELLLRSVHSPWAAWGLSGIFLASSAFSPLLQTPPIVFRIGFSTIFAGCGYITSTGDFRNGSGTTTAWALTYLFLYTKKTFQRPRSLWTMGLTMSTAACAAVHGVNYFVVQDFSKEAIDDQ